MSDVVLEVRGLRKHFPVTKGLLRRQIGVVKAVDGVDITLEKGRTLGLVGESGCGKSTLARMLVGIEKPTEGQILIDGTDVATMKGADRKALHATIQMVFQDPYTSLNPRMPVGEIVAEGYAIQPGLVPKKGKRAAVRELFDRVGLNPDHLNRYPHQFSGGQRQRIGIARALAVRPRILLCDEPVSALDVSVQGQVINLLEELQNDLGLSYLFIAHDLSVVRHIADEVAVMYLGRVVENGENDQVYDRTRHPYTQALLSAVPLPDPVAGAASQEIILEGDLPSPMSPPSGCRFHTRCWLAPLIEQAGGVDGKLPEAAAATADQDDIVARAEQPIPERCRTDDPTLQPQEVPTHVAACHFADRLLRR